MMTEEHFDIYDENGNPLGTAPRREVHARGLWHHSFQCWIVQEVKGERMLLFQLRHEDKDTYPGKLDISCAGHLAAGESVRDASREMEEELGLHVPFEELRPVGTYAQQKVIRTDLIDREVCHVFLYQSSRPLHNYSVQLDEVSGLYLIRLADAWKLVRDPSVSVPAAGFIVREEDGTYAPEERQVTFADLVPHDIAYYEWVLQAAEGMAV